MSKKHKQKSCHHPHKQSCKEKSHKKHSCCHCNCHHEKKACHHDHMCWGFLFPVCCNCRKESSSHQKHTSSFCDSCIDDHCESSSSSSSSSVGSSCHSESSSESRKYRCCIESSHFGPGNTHNHWLEACWSDCCNCIEIRVFHIK